MTYEHRWDLTPDEAQTLQIELATKVEETDGFDPATVRTVAGVDVAWWKEGEQEKGRVALVVLSLPDLASVEQVVVEQEPTFPYVPGLFSFREAPLVLAALKRLSTPPDVLMLDGQGRAHPRRFGLACHVGLLTGIPTIGVAKSLLSGKYEDLADTEDATAPLVDNGETVGMALRSRVGAKPVFVSVGHKVSLPTAIAVVRRCLRGYRLPETTRQADILAAIPLAPHS
jgi:deoxyribonuclease V